MNHDTNNPAAPAQTNASILTAESTDRINKMFASFRTGIHATINNTILQMCERMKEEINASVQASFQKAVLAIFNNTPEKIQEMVEHVSNKRAEGLSNEAAPQKHKAWSQGEQANLALFSEQAENKSIEIQPKAETYSVPRITWNTGE